MEILHVLHILILFVILSIPFWPMAYLRYGVYVPITISLIWVVFNGCPLTQQQTNLRSHSFTKEIYSIFVPGITVKMAEHVNTFAFLLITVIGMHRLCWECVAWCGCDGCCVTDASLLRAMPHNMSHFSINNESIYAVIIYLNFSRMMCCKNEKCL